MTFDWHKEFWETYRYNQPTDDDFCRELEKVNVTRESIVKFYETIVLQSMDTLSRKAIQDAKVSKQALSDVIQRRDYLQSKVEELTEHKSKLQEQLAFMTMALLDLERMVVIRQAEKKS